MNNNTILYDITTSLVGKPMAQRQSCATLFSLLGSFAQMRVDGLLYANQENPFAIEGQYPASRAEAIERATFFFHALLGHEKQHFVMKKMIKDMVSKFVPKKSSQYALYKIDPLLREVVWRNIFNHIVPYVSQKIILEQSFYYSNAIADQSCRLNTSEYEMAFFSGINSISVSPTTKKIIRLQNSTDIAEVDSMSYYICDSYVTQQALHQKLPDYEEKTYVAYSPEQQWVKKEDAKAFPLFHAMALRLSRTVYTGAQRQSYRALLESVSEMKYIVTTCQDITVQQSLLLMHAWENLRYQIKHNIKLIIVQDNEKLAMDVEDVLKQYTDDESIIFLDPMTHQEMASVWCHAALYISIASNSRSYSTVVSAMRYHCPMILPDIPLYHEIIGQAACYVDTTVEQDVIDIMHQLLLSNKSEVRCQELKINCVKEAGKMTHEIIANQWNDALICIQRGQA